MVKAIYLLAGGYPYEKCILALINPQIEKNLISERVFNKLSQSVKDTFERRGEITWGVFGKRNPPSTSFMDTIDFKMEVCKDIENIVLGKQFLHDKRGVKFGDHYVLIGEAYQIPLVGSTHADSQIVRLKSRYSPKINGFINNVNEKNRIDVQVTLDFTLNYNFINKRIFDQLKRTAYAVRPDYLRQGAFDIQVNGLKEVGLIVRYRSLAGLEVSHRIFCFVTDQITDDLILGQEETNFPRVHSRMVDYNSSAPETVIFRMVDNMHYLPMTWASNNNYV